MRTQTRIAAYFFITTLAIMVVLSGTVYYLVIQYTFSDFYKRLEIRAVVAARAVLETEESYGLAFQEMRDQFLEKLPLEKDYFFKIESDQTFTSESKELGLPISFFNDLVEGREATFQYGDTFYSGIRYEGIQGSHLVIVSAENYFYSHHLANLRKILLVAGILITLIALSVSVIFSRYVFNPVREITNRVKDISSQNLHLRLETSHVNDEVGELRTTFNNMLDRLETAFETQNNFISNASHELGTPLTAIIGEADVALVKERTPNDYKEALKVILTEAERLERITKSLLFLAQTGFDGIKQKFDKVRTDQLLWDVKETIERLNPKSKVHINLSLMPENPDQLKIKGNEQLLHLALTNIVSNGCKYSNNQPVQISIGISDRNVIIVVKDTGIGIPENELKYIYDPFFRASNSKDYEGYGIGLPLTRNIVRMHKGELLVSSKLNQGTTVQVIFPIGDFSVQ